MATETRQRIPWWGKVTLALTVVNSWVLFEETIVDRYGLWRCMPLYRVGRVCAWDVAVLVVVLVGLGWSARLRGRPSTRPEL